MESAFTAVFEKVDDWYIGYVEELSGVNTQGETLEEVRKNLREAVELILKSNQELALAFIPASFPFATQAHGRNQGRW